MRRTRQTFVLDKRWHSGCGQTRWQLLKCSHLPQLSHKRLFEAQKRINSLMIIFINLSWVSYFTGLPSLKMSQKHLAVCKLYFRRCNNTALFNVLLVVVVQLNFYSGAWKALKILHAFVSDFLSIIPGQAAILKIELSFALRCLRRVKARKSPVD